MKKNFFKSAAAALLAMNLMAVNVAMAEENDKDKDEIENVEKVKKNEKNKELAVPEISAKYAVTIDAITGQVLFGKNEHEQAYPASITKVLTALLLVENFDEKDEVVIANACANITRSSSQANYVEGETMDRNTALNAMLVTSANDLACSIGATIAGSEEEFGAMMTKRAKELGAKNSNFVNASGLDIEGHQTTAYDIAMITREAIKHEEILKAMGTKSYEMKTSEQETTVSNKNKILNDENALGGKTGFTDNAGNTQARVDEVDGKRVITVVMKSSLGNIYDEIKEISEYGASRLKEAEFTYDEEVEIFGEEVLMGLDKPIKLNLLDEKEKVDFEIQVSEKLKEEKIIKDGIQKGDKLGKVLVKIDGEVVTDFEAVVLEGVSYKKGFNSNVKQDDAKEGLGRSTKALIAILLPILSYLMIMVYYNRKVIENRKKRNK